MVKKDLTLADMKKSIPQGGLMDPALRVMKTDVKNIHPWRAPKIGNFKNVTKR